MHGLEFAVLQPVQTGLHEGGGDGDRCGHVDVVQLVGQKKQQNREQVEEELHDRCLRWEAVFVRGSRRKSVK